MSSQRAIACQLGEDLRMRRNATAGFGRLADATDPRLPRELLTVRDEMEASLQEAIKELRAFTYLLHPVPLQTDGLVATLQRYVDGFVARTHLRAALRVEGPVGKIPLSHQQAVLRIVQEALAKRTSPRIRVARHH